MPFCCFMVLGGSGHTHEAVRRDPRAMAGMITVLASIPGGTVAASTGELGRSEIWDDGTMGHLNQLSAIRARIHITRV
jgi:hypothetical protein